MNKRHVHADVIIAWANGEEIEFKEHTEKWIPVKAPRWHEDREYRVKPKIVKREGWVNIYKYELGDIDRKADLIHSTKESADALGAGREACIRIEWEEEV